MRYLFKDGKQIPVDQPSGPPPELDSDILSTGQDSERTSPKEQEAVKVKSLASVSRPGIPAAQPARPATTPTAVAPEQLARAEKPNALEKAAPASDAWGALPHPTEPKALSFDVLVSWAVRDGLLSASMRQDAIARKEEMRKKLMRDIVGVRYDVRAARHGQHEYILSPIELLAAFQFPQLKGENQVLDEETIMQVVAREAKLNYHKLRVQELKPPLVLKTFTRQFARRYTAITLAVDDEFVTIATDNPWNNALYSDLIHISKKQVKVVVASKTNIMQAINEIYGFKRERYDFRMRGIFPQQAGSPGKSLFLLLLLGAIAYGAYVYASRGGSALTSLEAFIAPVRGMMNRAGNTFNDAKKARDMLEEENKKKAETYKKLLNE